MGKRTCRLIKANNMKIIIFLALILLSVCGFSEPVDSIIIHNQYHTRLKETSILINGNKYTTDDRGKVYIGGINGDSLKIDLSGYEQKNILVRDIPANKRIELKKIFNWKDIFNPEFYIIHGGLWLVMFIVFAETGLLVGFFLPGDALLFVTGILSGDIVSAALFDTGSQWADLGILWLLISIAGILGNLVGYWFGKRSGPFLYHRKDTLFFKKKYLLQAHDFYEKNGGGAIIIARFVPFVRTFAPIVAGVVEMDKKKFVLYNVIGSILWVGSMLVAGHFLQSFVRHQFGFDLKEHLEVIVIGIVVITTFPILWKVFFSKKKPQPVPQKKDKQI
jgi:membrane-associated protein